MAAYAIGGLPPAEAEQLEKHIDGCARCRGRLSWLSPAVDVLPAVSQRTSPPELRERIMADVRADARTRLRWRRRRGTSAA